MKGASSEAFVLYWSSQIIFVKEIVICHLQKDDEQSLRAQCRISSTLDDISI